MAYHSRENESKSRNIGGALIRVGLAALVLGGAGAVAMYRNSILSRFTRVFAAAEEDPIPVERLSRAPYQLEAPAVGEVIGLATIPVPTPSTRSGALRVGWLITEGSFVRENDPVIRFDSTDAQLNVERQENTLEANSEKTKITTGQQTTTDKVLGFDKADAEKEYQYAMTVLPQDETIFSKWDIIEAKINAGFAKEKIDFLGNKGRVQKRINRADQQILAIEKSRAQAELSIAKQTLDSLVLRAPKAGLLLYRRDRMREPQIGDESWQGQVLVELVDLNALQARIYVLERDAGSLAKDKPVLIHLDSIHERTFHGTVRSVSALAQPLERGSPLKYFTCEVTITDASEDLSRIKPGMALKAEVVLDRYDSCFVVPASAVTSKGAENLVYIKQGDKFLARSVKLGSGAHGQATILDGVKENEIVAMRNPFESRKVRLPDFSKAPAGGGGGRFIMFR
jgi:hypothetical protein